MRLIELFRDPTGGIPSKVVQEVLANLKNVGQDVSFPWSYTTYMQSSHNTSNKVTISLGHSVRGRINSCERQPTF